MASEESSEAVGDGVVEELGHTVDTLGGVGDVGRQDLAL